MSNLATKLLSVETQQHHPEAFPLIHALAGDCDLDDVTAWLAVNAAGLLEDLARHGAILFRGFPLSTDLEFDRFVSSFGLANFAYADSLSNAVRVNRTGRVFTANEAPASVSIFLHHEMAQTPVFPSRLFFFCEHAADSGGATPLCRSDILLDQLQQQAPEFVKECEQKGVRYTNVMPADDDPQSGQGRSWRSTLGADDKAAAEAKLRKLGYQWQWQGDDSLQVTTPVLPAIKTLADGRRVFFNQLIAAFRGWKDKRNQDRKSISFGDGSDISGQAMATAIELGDDLSFDLDWKTGDVALVDNFLVMHGRRPYKGERRVLASLAAE